MCMFIVRCLLEFRRLHNLHPWYWNDLSYAKKSHLLWEEFTVCALCCSYSQSLQFSFLVLVPPGTRHCWVIRGSMIWEACPTPLRMTGSVTRAPVTHRRNLTWVIWSPLSPHPRPLFSFKIISHVSCSCLLILSVLSSCAWINIYTWSPTHPTPKAFSFLCFSSYASYLQASPLCEVYWVGMCACLCCGWKYGCRRKRKDSDGEGKKIECVHVISGAKKK